MIALNCLIHKYASAVFKPESLFTINKLIFGVNSQFKSFDNELDEFNLTGTVSTEYHTWFGANISTNVLTAVIDVLVNKYTSTSKSKYVYDTEEIKNFLLKYKDDLSALEIYMNANAHANVIRKLYFVVKFKEKTAYDIALLGSAKCKTTTSYYEYDRTISFYPDLTRPVS